jgi:hypothetical protein
MLDDLLVESQQVICVLALLADLPVEDHQLFQISLRVLLSPQFLQQRKIELKFFFWNLHKLRTGFLCKIFFQLSFFELISSI